LLVTVEDQKLRESDLELASKSGQKPTRQRGNMQRNRTSKGKETRNNEASRHSR
jgi:hypothetical protein